MEIGVRVIDAATGEHVEAVGSLSEANRKVRYWQRIDATRRTYGVRAEIVTRASRVDEWKARTDA